MAAPADATLLEIVARVPAAAALILARGGALSLEDRKALRLAHSELREVVNSVATVLKTRQEEGAPAAPPPTALRWPALLRLELELPAPELAAALRALGAATWPFLHTLFAYQTDTAPANMGVAAVRALAAAAPRMPALTCLHLGHFFFGEAEVREMFARPGPWARLDTVIFATATTATAASSGL